MTYEEFMREHGWKIDVLEIFDADGCEIEDTDAIDPDAEVLDFTNESGFYDLQLAI